MTLFEAFKPLVLLVKREEVEGVTESVDLC